MQEGILNSTSYQNLVKDISFLISDGKKKAEDLVKNQMMLTYWQVGKRIANEQLTHNSNYYWLILEDVSKETGVDKATLSRSVQFFKLYPNQPQLSNLSWSHYKSLIALKSPDLRVELEEKAKKENWSKNKLIEAIKIRSEESSQSLDTQLTRPTKPNYLYKATIANVIDGDTLLLDIDLGFQTIRKQRVRLNQINAPEIKTKKGKESFNYLRDLSANLGTVIVKTNKIDIYGRYLADIFYPLTKTTNQTTQAEIFQTGVYLNEQIVSEGFASKV